MNRSLEILDHLIGFNTLNSRSNLHMVNFIEEFLVSRGFRVHRLADPAEEKAGLYAEIGPETEGGVVLSAHSDVVPVDGQTWTRPPFRLIREGDWLYGRGTTDMKGFLAEMLAVADKASTMMLKVPLKLLISYDEEIGCVGIERMRERLIPLIGSPRLAIVGEPTEMRVATGHKGKRAYRAHLAGQAGHSSLAPNYISALQVGVDFVMALRRLQEDIRETGACDPEFDVPYTTLHVGTFRSGTALNIVPDAAELTYEFRHVPEDDPDVLEQRIADAAQAVTPRQLGSTGIRIDRQASYPGLRMAATHDAVKQAQVWAGTETCKVGFGTEAGVLSEMGIPSVVCGPGSMDTHGHKADECISISQLNACAQMLDKVLKSLC